MRYIAEYVASDGVIFSCPLTFQNNRWMLATEHGPRDFDYYLKEELSPSGWLEFSDIKLSANGLRPADFIDSDYRMRCRVPVPKKPVEQAVQKVDTAPDTGKLHIDNTMPGSRLQKLQSAFAFKEMEQRGQREQERRAIQNQSQPTERQVASAKQHVAQALRDRKPRGRGGYFEVEKKN